jgi:hypothetical protein
MIRDRLRLSLERCGNWSGVCDDKIGLQIDQLFRKHPHSISIAGGPANTHAEVAAISPTQLSERVHEAGKPGFWFGIVFVERHQHADPAHLIGQLRTRDKRPTGRSTADKRDELAPPHGHPLALATGP